MRNAAPAPAADLISSAEAAEILGFTVAWTNKLAARGHLPVVRKMRGRTGAYLFSRDAIEQHARGPGGPRNPTPAPCQAAGAP